MGVRSMMLMLTPAMSKTLIAMGVASGDCIEEKLKKGTVVITAGTTNGYVAEAILKKIGCEIGELKSKMVRGVILPPNMRIEKAEIADVVIIDGKWEKDLTFPEIMEKLTSGDIIIKGGNAVNPETGDVGVIVGHPQAGTVGNIYHAVYGRRVRVISPIGLEKRVYVPISDIAELVNDCDVQGPRMAVLPGKAYTEIEAIADLCCCEACLIAGGGVMGAEGTCVFHVVGEEADIEEMKKIYEELRKVPNFSQN